jgi:REP element-mobilizing transposase RayT
MPRPDRVFVAGGVYHVYNRIGRGERAFDGAEEAASFVELLRRVASRDGLTVYAWCLMSNHSGSLQRRSRRPLMACRTRLHGESGAGRMVSASGVSSGSWTVDCH